MSITEAAERCGVSTKTCGKWCRRYLAGGELGLIDRSSGPHCSPNQTPAGKGRGDRRVAAVALHRPSARVPPHLGRNSPGWSPVAGSCLMASRCIVKPYVIAPPLAPAATGPHDYEKSHRARSSLGLNRGSIDTAIATASKSEVVP
jgi:hypothetical protein